jgi:hypothetical protein
MDCENESRGNDSNNASVVFFIPVKVTGKDKVDNTIYRVHWKCDLIPGLQYEQRAARPQKIFGFRIQYYFITGYIYAVEFTKFAYLFTRIIITNIGQMARFTASKKRTANEALLLTPSNVCPAVIIHFISSCNGQETTTIPAGQPKIIKHRAQIHIPTFVVVCRIESMERLVLQNLLVVLHLQNPFLV